jgi:hypothetical protein
MVGVTDFGLSRLAMLTSISLGLSASRHDRRAAAAAEMAERLSRGTIGDGVALRHRKGVERHRQPDNYRGAMRPLTHPTMAIERLDGRGGNAVAYLAAQAAAGKIFFHNLSPLRNPPMTLDVFVIQPLVALIAGILILLIPRILNYVVAIYLIFIGLVGLWPRLFHIPH